jgi:hypothetical protein
MGPAQDARRCCLKVAAEASLVALFRREEEEGAVAAQREAFGGPRLCDRLKEEGVLMEGAAAGVGARGPVEPLPPSPSSLVEFSLMKDELSREHVAAEVGAGAGAVFLTSSPPPPPSLLPPSSTALLLFTSFIQPTAASSPLLLKPLMRLRCCLRAELKTIKDVCVADSAAQKRGSWRKVAGFGIAEAAEEAVLGALPSPESFAARATLALAFSAELLARPGMEERGGVGALRGCCCCC